MYVDLEFNPNEGDDDALCRFEFLTEEDARQAGGAWFRVRDVLELGEAPSIFRWVRRHGLAEHATAFETLDSLWRAIHTREAVSFFEEDTTELDRVLEIFIGTNSGGTVLSRDTDRQPKGVPTSIAVVGGDDGWPVRSRAVVLSLTAAQRRHRRSSILERTAFDARGMAATG